MATTTTRRTGASKPTPLIDREDLAQLQAGQDLLVQYLNETHAFEGQLVTTLGAHIAMTPEGPYRKILERHLDETRAQTQGIERRLAELGNGRTIVQQVVGVVETVAAQAFALSKGPFDLIRGVGGEEKLVKNAKDEMTTEQQEIANYVAIEALAHALGDEKTAAMAVEYRKQEERTLEEIREQLPTLTSRVVLARAKGVATYDPAKTGAGQGATYIADQVSEKAGQVRDSVEDAASDAADSVRETGDRARRFAKDAVDGEDKPKTTNGRTAPRASKA